MTLHKGMAFTKKIFTAEIKTVDWDRTGCSPYVAQWKTSANSVTGLSFAHFFIIHAPEKGNGGVIANHYMNKTENLPLYGSKFKKIFPDVMFALACCHE